MTSFIDALKLMKSGKVMQDINTSYLYRYVGDDIFFSHQVGINSYFQMIEWNVTTLEYLFDANFVEYSYENRICMSFSEAFRFLRSHDKIPVTRDAWFDKNTGTIMKILYIDNSIIGDLKPYIINMTTSPRSTEEFVPTFDDIESKDWFEVV